jgi:peroxiredoxin
MAQTPSQMLPLGTVAPAFSLPDTDGKTCKNTDFGGKPLLVMFICNHCPFVKHVAAELARLGRDYAARGVGIVAINSNDVQKYADDRPELMKVEKQNQGWTFPYLFDESQTVAKAYQAACTPDFYLFDEHHKLVYRGQLDASRPGNSVPVSGSDLRGALDSLLGGKPQSPDQKPSIGCNIKWRPGHAPAYFC